MRNKGYTRFDEDHTVLDAILSQWSSGADYLGRIDRLRKRAAGLIADLTVLDDGVKDQRDGVKDTLHGGKDRDWFFADLGGRGGR